MEIELDRLAAMHSFGGVVGIEREVANTVDHRFGIASGVKTLTAVRCLGLQAAPRGSRCS